MVGATGPIDFVSEVGEQLGWLASTLRTSPVSNGILMCTPKLSALQMRNWGTLPLGVAIVFSCRIKFSMMLMPQDTTSLSPGSCWVNLFRNPILVTGYPIRRRSTPDTGLEMSLHVIAELVQSHLVTLFDKRVVIKGFCSLLVATAILADAVIWHLLFDPSGERISYCDPRLDEVRYGKIPQELMLRDLGSRSHIVGWCSNIREYSGKRARSLCILDGPNQCFQGCESANLSIQASNLPTLPDSVAIEKLYLEGGGSAVAGVSVALGKKDQPVRMSRGTSFSDLLACVVKKPMVLYDTSERRAWLVDGASALLYLVRASIDRDRANPVYGSKWKFDGEGQFKGGSAIEILSNPDNLDIKLYLDCRQRTESGSQDVFYYFQDRVHDISRNVEILMDYQVHAAARDGYWVYQSGDYFKKKVVGFEFWDVAKPEFHTFRRFHTIPTWGYGWVDYIRSIGALIVFGEGFGDLIRPETPSVLCSDWASIRTGRDLLCSSISTLKSVQSAKTGPHLHSGELTSEILWSSCSRLFATCPCVSHPLGCRGDTAHTDPVQVLLPKVGLRNLRLNPSAISVEVSLFELDDSGAVVFGHTPYHKTRLKYKRPGGRDKAQSRSPSSTGSSASDVAGSGSSASGEGAPSTPFTTPPSSQIRTSDRSSESEGDMNIEGTPTSTRKRKNGWFEGGWIKKMRFWL